jgi:3-hydroxyacyl-CoA dehydrogenase
VTPRPFRTAAVLGAGVMGSRIAAHLANAGLLVDLLDLAAGTGPRDGAVRAALASLRRANPPPLFGARVLERISPGNFEDDLPRLARADWIVEAVVENLDVKRGLLARTAASARDDAVVSTNTSALSIGALAEALPAAMRPRFLGTHFFNPPRQLALLELAPSRLTDAAVLERVAHLARTRLGKGVVVARDTPGFVANRIGAHAFLLALRAVVDGGFSIGEVDELTGRILGRPKSATFRAADLAGLDTVLRVAEHLAASLPSDEAAAFAPPALLRRLVETGALGAKAGRGFYRKVDGRILEVDPTSLRYETPRASIHGLAAIASKPDLSGRLAALLADDGRSGSLFRDVVLRNLAYAAHRLPEIAESPADVDRAMRWGYGWELGPFETWDAAGFGEVVSAMRRLGLAAPAWIDEIDPMDGFYRVDAQGRDVWTPTAGRRRADEPADEIRVADVRRAGRVRWSDDDASVVEMGRGALLFEFHTKAGTIGRSVLDALERALDLAETGDDAGLVIASSGDDFSLGADLGEIALAAVARRWKEIERSLARFQDLARRVRRASVPVVVAVRGRAFGGGCELAMACAHPVAAADSYLGLVEAGVGLVPAGGGAARMTALAADRAFDAAAAAVEPHLRRAFETVARAAVSTSAEHAVELGFLPAGAPIVARADRLLFVAREEALRLAAQGHAPPPPRVCVRALGAPARAAIEVGLRHLRLGRFIDEHDEVVARKLAWVMTGGDLAAPADVSEDHLLALEREAFLSLLGEPATQERIADVLTRGRPAAVRAAARGVAALAGLFGPPRRCAEEGAP